MSASSTERFLQQLERCVKYQNEHIMLPDPPRASDTIIESTEFIAPEEMGNGAAEPYVDQPGVWGLRPPGEANEPPMVIGDWA